MNYLFFDIECANCLHGEGKICSFGYVKTDENFNILRKKDILINPNAPFILNDTITHKGIRLAYPYYRFKQSHLFPTYYWEIKKLLEDKNNIVMGFATEQDVSFLISTCKRYNLNLLNFDYYDVQIMDKIVNNKSDVMSLEHVVEQNNLNVLTFHRSDDDALMTMEVYQLLVKNSGLDSISFLNQLKNTKGNSISFLKILEDRKAKKQIKINHRIAKDKFFSELENISANLEKYDKYFWNNTFCVDHTLFTISIDELKDVFTKVKEKGGFITSNHLEADIIVTLDKNKIPNYLVEDKDTKEIISYDDLKKLI